MEHDRQRPRFATMRRLCERLGVEASEVEEFVEALDEMGKADAISSPAHRLAHAPASVGGAGILSA